MKDLAYDAKAVTDGLDRTAEILKDSQKLDLDRVTPQKTLLVIVDMVNGFVNDGAMADRRIREIIPDICGLMKRCKEKGIASAAFADSHNEDCAEFASFPPHCIKGTAEEEIVDEIKEIGGYRLIPKNSTNGFHEPQFRKLLDEGDFDTFIVTGDCTDICVMQFCLSLKTWFNAADKSCSVLVPVNCVETYNSPTHDAVLANLTAAKLMIESGMVFVKA